MAMAFEHRTTRLVGTSFLLAAPLFSCGENESDGESGRADDISVDGGLSSSKDNDVPCQTDGECNSSEVCHPQVGVCVRTGGSCSNQEGCTPGYACATDLGKCVLGLPGTSCSSDVSCQPGSTCAAGVCACSGFEQEQETLGGPLDIYFIFDRTASMGKDCAYEHGSSPPENSKACFATYAMSDYLIDVSPMVDTRLAFQFMSYPESCDGTPYRTPLIPLTPLPVPVDHELISAISGETFDGGSGTQIEGALNGIVHFTSANRTPGREMIGVLMTDGDPTDHCEQDIVALTTIIESHRQTTGLRTFIIGMEGATEENLEQLAIAGGAESHADFCGELEPPCHYWNVGNGQGAVLASALSAIVKQASPLPCEYALAEIEPQNGQELDLSTLNVQLSQPSGTSLISNVETQGDCPNDQEAWHYDDRIAPKTIVLCPSTCDLVKLADRGARMSIVGGCEETMMIR